MRNGPKTSKTRSKSVSKGHPSRINNRARRDGVEEPAACPSVSLALNLIEFVGGNNRSEASPLPRGSADVCRYQPEQSESRVASGEVPRWLN